MAASTVIGVLSIAFPPLMVVAPAVKHVEHLLALLKSDKSIQKEERELSKMSLDLLKKINSQQQNFEAKALQITAALEKYIISDGEIVNYKKSAKESYERWEDEIVKLKDIAEKQKKRLEGRTVAAASNSSKLVLATSAVMAVINRVAAASDAKGTSKAQKRELELLEKIETRASWCRQEIVSEADAFLNSIKQEPVRAAGWFSPTAQGEPKNPVFEKEFARLMAISDDPIKNGLAAAALACRNASPAHVYFALERVHGVNMRDFASTAREGESLRLSEPSVSDLACCLKTFGTTRSEIVELCWQVCWGSLKGDDDELDQEIAKWSRAGFISLAAEGLFHMLLPDNKSGWTDSIDDLCTAIGRLTQSATVAKELFTKYPFFVKSLVEDSF